jgi:hypothetical protein
MNSPVSAVALAKVSEIVPFATSVEASVKFVKIASTPAEPTTNEQAHS